MRRTALLTLSTAHIPVRERAEIDRLIQIAPRDASGRLCVDHGDLVIEPYQYGFFVHTGIAGVGADDPSDISPALWHIVRLAHETGANWILFDRDEPVCDLLLPVFADEQDGDPAAPGAAS